MSSIIFPMEICRVPRDSWAGRMYASRVKLNMLVTANSTSAISWGSSWCQSSRTEGQIHTATHRLSLKLKKTDQQSIWTKCVTWCSHQSGWNKHSRLCRCGRGRGGNLWAWWAHVKRRTPGTCWAPSCPSSSTNPGSSSAAPRSTLPYTRTRRTLHGTAQKDLKPFHQCHHGTELTQREWTYQPPTPYGRSCAGCSAAWRQICLDTAPSLSILRVMWWETTDMRPSGGGTWSQESSGSFPPGENTIAVVSFLFPCCNLLRIIYVWRFLRRVTFDFGAIQ